MDDEDLDSKRQTVRRKRERPKIKYLSSDSEFSDASEVRSASECEEEEHQGDGGGGPFVRRSIFHANEHEVDNDKDDCQQVPLQYSDFSLRNCVFISAREKLWCCLLILLLLLPLFFWLHDFVKHRDAFASVLIRDSAAPLFPSSFFSRTSISETLDQSSNDIEKMSNQSAVHISNLESLLKTHMADRCKDVETLSLSVAEMDARLKKMEQIPRLSKEEIEARVERKARGAIDIRVTQLMNELDEFIADSTISEASIDLLVRDAFEKATYGDETGETDWMERVVAFSPPAYAQQNGLFRTIQCTIGTCTRPASDLIEASTRPGDCYPFRGSTGFVVYSLLETISLTHVRLSHMAPEVSATPGSMPKDFGIDVSLDGHQWDTVGDFTYNAKGTPTQRFEFSPVTAAHVRFRLRSNYGAATHTCLYRLRAHGGKV